MEDFIVIIMAGGQGKRFGNNKVKVLQEVFGKPMIVHLITTAQRLNPKRILVIVGKYKEQIEAVINDMIHDTKNISYVVQENSQGTGHALQCCIPILQEEYDCKTIILSGDTPLIEEATIRDVVSMVSDVTLVVRDTAHQLGGGRVLINGQGKFVRIVEEVDATPEEKRVTLVNTGIYAVRANLLTKNLPLLTCNNAQREYYLTDVVKLIQDNDRCDITIYKIPEERWYEVIGVNTPDDLEYLIRTKEKVTVQST